MNAWKRHGEVVYLWVSHECAYLKPLTHTGSHERLLLRVFDVHLICILKASNRQGGGRRGGGSLIILTDSVYVSLGAVEADRLDKVSDWPGEIYDQRVTVNIHLEFYGPVLNMQRYVSGIVTQLLLKVLETSSIASGCSSGEILISKCFLVLVN